MAINYPYTIGFFADKLKISSVEWTIQRNDELSGSGDGRVWQAELAPPLWVGTVGLSVDRIDTLKQVAALIRKLHGAQEALLMYDPLSKYPQADPTGSILGASVVAVNSIASDRSRLSLSGLPAGYKLTLADKLSITYGIDPVRYAFLEFSESITANGSGVTGLIEVFPHIPAGIVAGAAVTLIKPPCKCIIYPDSHSAGTTVQTITENAGFKVLQKK